MTVVRCDFAEWLDAGKCRPLGQLRAIDLREKLPNGFAERQG
jgi:hypothetical protein